MKRGAVLILTIFITILLSGVFLMGAKSMQRKTSINRAFGAIISASSYRRARFSEVQGRSVLLYLPQVWNHWIPGYAVDKDPQTFWATKSASSEWIRIKLKSKLMPKVPIARLVIQWGNNLPARYSVRISDDGRNFESVKEIIFEQAKKRTIEFNPPIYAGWLELYFYQAKTKKGISIREIEVYGPESESMPSAPLSVQAEAVSPTEIRLSYAYGG